MNLEFIDPGHRYLMDGREVPSVTRVIAPLQDFSRVPPDRLEAARVFGQDVHTACELADLGNLDEEHLQRESPEVFACLTAWRRFTVECKPTWYGIEEIVGHARRRYAGRLDRRGLALLKLSGRRQPVHGVFDIKSSLDDEHASHGVQIAGYADAVESMDGLSPTKYRRFSVHLSRDGTYRLREWTDPSDLPTFISCLTVLGWQQKHLRR